MKSIFSIFTESANSFEGQENGEKVILILRAHSFIILGRLAFFVFPVLIPPAAGLLFFSFLSSHNLLKLFFFISSLWYLVLWQIIFYYLTMYILSTWTVTDRRIINSTQNGLFNRTVSEIRLSRIQDVSVNVNGIIPTFFRFGDLQIQSAGTEGKIKFSQIPHPEKVKDAIMQIIHHTY